MVLLSWIESMESQEATVRKAKAKCMKYVPCVSEPGKECNRKTLLQVSHSFQDWPASMKW